MQGKLTLAVCLFLGAVGGFVGWARIPERHRGPHLSVDPVVELGTLNHDEYRSITLALRNDGTAILELEQPLIGCACTKGTLSKTSLEPGESAEVAIRYHAAQHPGAEVKQPIILPSNCRETPQRQVVLHGRMRGALLAVPSVMNVGGVRPGEAWQRSVRVRHSDADVTFRAGRATTGVDGWSVAVKQTAPDECEIRISSLGGSVIGTQRGLVSVETDLASTPLEIPVTVDVRSELRAVPSPLLFRRRNSDDPFEEDILVIHGPAGMRLTPGDDNSAIECEPLTNEGSDSQSVRFRMSVSGNPTQTERGVIKFRVKGLSHESEFSVPFLVVP